MGSIAALEAPLTSRRSILINPYHMKGGNIAFVKKAGLLYQDIHTAIDTVTGYRQGRPEFGKLGLLAGVWKVRRHLN